ncbi:hypothetical protein [Microbacterium sp. YY-01]|uniref:hypothetical protein n=1 Tax=Microbacterium sp. YY-01 TaxID=3421634 RepID=UPI003D17814D
MSTKLKNWHNSLIKVLDEHEAAARRYRRELDEGLLTESGVTDALDKARTSGKWLERVDEIATNVNEWIDLATADVHKARAALTKPVDGTATEQLLAETRAVRAWNRLRQRMENAGEVKAEVLGLDAVKTTVGDERRIILEELGGYIEYRGGGNDFDDRINKALAESDEDYSRALNYLNTAKKTASWLVTAANKAREHVAGSRLASSNEATLDLMVRNIPAERLQTAEGAGNLTDAGRRDTALGEFQR